MIKIDNLVLPNPKQWDLIIRGMRNPMNSWDKLDSGFVYVNSKNFDKLPDKNRYILSESDVENGIDKYYFFGYNDYKLMKRLCSAGTDHRKFLRMITIYVDITAPLYWLKEFDTYKVGTVANSCSTMHKIAEKEFTINDFSCEHLLETSVQCLEETICQLNKCRDLYLGYDGFKYEIGEYDKKTYWWQMIQLLPTSYNQKRTVLLNYEVLANIYKSRNNHKLDEWRDFCKWIETLPLSELITENSKE